VIVGSWYGKHDVLLKLGLTFHRSHIIIKTSQVSEISATLSDRWDKSRRFETVWSQLRRLMPSKLFEHDNNSMIAFEVHDVQAAYSKLEDGSLLTAVLQYSTGSKN
jgi:hypothetical protein